MKSFGQTKFLLGVFGMLAIVALTASSYLLLSTWGAYNKSLTLSAELQLKRDREAGLLDIRKLLLDSESEREQINSYFVLEDGEAGYIESLESVASNSSLDFSIGSVSVASLQEQPNFQMIHLEAQVEGKFQDIINFLTSLEGRPLAHFVRSLTLEWAGDEKDASVWKSEITINALQRKSLSSGVQ